MKRFIFMMSLALISMGLAFAENQQKIQMVQYELGPPVISEPVVVEGYVSPETVTYEMAMPLNVSRTLIMSNATEYEAIALPYETEKLQEPNWADALFYRDTGVPIILCNDSHLINKKYISANRDYTIKTDVGNRNSVYPCFVWY